MTSRLVRLTKGPCMVASAGADGFDTCVEVFGFPTARLVLKVIGADNPDSPSFVLELRTSMDIKDRADATIAGAFTFTGTKNHVMAQTFTGLLRYLWWSVRSFEGQADALHFTLEGVVYE